MDTLLRNAFKKQIESKVGTEFEDFIDKLLLLKYGESDYIPIRRTRDKGNDGTILSEQKVIACYAPKAYKKAEFITKVQGNSTVVGDFTKYKNNWEGSFPFWEMYVSHEVAPEQLELIKSLDGNTNIKGIDQILFIIEELLSTKKRKLAEYLGVEEFFKQDYIKEVIDDLLNASTKRLDIINFDKKGLTPPRTKIELNFKEEDWDGINSEMSLAMTDFDTIYRILSGYRDEEINTIKRRIISDYNNLSGSFKRRLYNLEKLYTELYGNIEDDEYKKCVKSILLYMFEQCLIGKKAEI